METLVTEVPAGPGVTAAADLVMELLGSGLHNALSVEEIPEGRWLG